MMKLVEIILIAKRKLKQQQQQKSDHTQSINFCFEVHTRKVALSLIIIDLTINLLLRSFIQFFSQDFLKSFHTEGVLSCFHQFPQYRICEFGKVQLQVPIALFGNKKVHISNSSMRHAYKREKRESLAKELLFMLSWGKYSMCISEKQIYLPEQLNTCQFYLS